MVLAKNILRNPSEPAKPPSAYEEKFIIAQLDIIQESLQLVRNRSNPRKPQKKQPSNKELNSGKKYSNVYRQKHLESRQFSRQLITPGKPKDNAVGPRKQWCKRQNIPE